MARMQTLHVIPSRCHARVTLIALLLGGCGGASLTPENFRQQMAGSAEQLDVARPLRDVGASFRERASACLNVTTKTYGGPAVRYTMQVWAYKASVVVTDARVELHVRAKYEGPTPPFTIKGRMALMYSSRMRPPLAHDEPIWSSGPTHPKATLFATQ